MIDFSAVTPEHYPRFFYKKNSGLPEYSDIPLGHFSVNRLIHGQPCFRQPMSSFNWEKRVLILSDWTAEQWRREKIVQVMTLLHHLKEQGFHVSIWQNGELVSFDGEFNRREMIPVTQEELLQVARQNPATQKPLHILDMFELSQLIHDKEKDAYDFEVKYYNQTCYPQDKVLDVLKKSPITSLICRNFPCDIEVARTLSVLLQHKPIAYQFSLLRVEYDDLNDFLYHSNSLRIDDFYSVRVEFSDIEVLQLYGAFRRLDSSFIADLLQKLPRLQELDMSGFKFRLKESMNLSSNLALEVLKLSGGLFINQILPELSRCASLKELHCSFNSLSGMDDSLKLNTLVALNLIRNTISAEHLYFILSKTNCLKILNLSQCPQIKDIPAELNLNYLEELNLSKANISAQSLYFLLKNSNYLKSLYLDDARLFNRSIPTLHLHYLELFDASKSTINSNVLYALLIHAQRLKALNLSETELDLSSLEAFDLKCLIEINLAHCRLLNNSLDVLLHRTETLERLNVQDCKAHFDKFVTGHFSLLKEADWSHTIITGENLYQFLLNSPGLKRLKLNNCRNIHHPFGPLNQNVLEELELECSILGVFNLNNLLLHSTNLKKLNLSFCKIDSSQIQNLNALNFMSLPFLEELDISHTTVSAKGLYALLNKTKHLKKLNLSFCNELIEGFYGIDLGTLEGLYLQETQISSKGLKALLKTANYLKTLKLSSCCNIDKVFDIPFLPYLRELDVSDSSISAQALQKLLEQTPNLQVLDLSNCKQLKEHNFSDTLLIFLENIPEITYPESYTFSKTPFNKFLPDRDKIQEIPEEIDIPEHDHRSFQYYPESSEHFEFHYEGTNKTKNQGMIIEKLSQYLVLTGQHQNWIPALQQGICNALVSWYRAQNSEPWNAIIKKFSLWDGQAARLTPVLSLYFDALIHYVAQFQLQNDEQSYYVGDNLAFYLSQLAEGDSLVISNPWHAIALKRNSGDLWYFYDPNCSDGEINLEGRALLDVISYSLGHLIKVNGRSPQIMPDVKDAEQFIEEGGLISLYIVENKEALLQALKLPAMSELKDKTFDGLFLYTTDGEQAWSLGLRTPELIHLTQHLLQEYLNRHPQTDKEQFAKSKPPVQPDLDLLNVSKQDEQSRYECALATWEKTNYRNISIKQYSQLKCRPNGKKKHLIELTSNEEVLAMQSALLQYCVSVNKPIFCVNSPEDLICRLPFVACVDLATGEGQLRKAPGGRLYEFLQQHQLNKDNPPVLLIDYSTFKPNDIIRFNAMLDTHRKADGEKIPEPCIVIGLTNINAPDCYSGSDFYSRFGRSVDKAPFTLEQLKKATPPPFFQKQTDELHDVTIIRLFHASDWKERLIGRWVLNKNQLFYEDGALLTALQSGKPIVIENGLLEDHEFMRFWQQAQITGFIPHPIKPIPFTVHDKIVLHHEGYDWNYLLKNTQWDRCFHPQGIVLNPGQLSQLLVRNEFQDSYLNSEPGFLAMKAQEDLEMPLHLNLTRAMTEDEWAICLQKAQDLGVKLHIHCPPSVPLPKECQALVKEQDVTSLLDPVIDSICLSTDVDTTVASFCEHENSLMVIDISECNASNILTSIHGHLDTETLKFVFQQRIGVVSRALDDNKKVLLKGAFSSELIDALAPLLLSRQMYPKAAKGQLLIVSDDEAVAPYLVPDRHQVTWKEKHHFLKHASDEILASIGAQTLEQESLANLQSRINYLQKHPGASSDEAWAGFYSLEGFPILKTIDFKCSKEQARTFHQQRLDLVHEGFKKYPFVFLTGLTGVGKTTFVTEHLAQEGPLYQGESQLKKWAEDKSKKIKYLFIDEANLIKRLWSELEGLFNEPPAILIDGSYEDLDEYHRVVFAGNPLNYGDERRIVPFFQRHGNAILFEPLPLACIYEDILKPLFSGTRLEHQTEQVCKPLLEIYRFLCERSQDEVLISPRELQMMALLVCSYQQRYPDCDVFAVAQCYAYQLAKHLIPDKHQPEFVVLFPEPVRLEHASLIEQPGYLDTPSRLQSIDLLDDVLHLRHYRQTIARTQAQKTGGLGGIIYEGEPGIGKSEQVIRLLREHHFIEIHLNQEVKLNCANGFYTIPVSMDEEEKERILLKAFHEGAVVVIDEINSSPMMERLLNSLLMGKTKEGLPPEKPGFLVIGTQNPATLEGRTVPSPAFSRRLITVQIEPYSIKEMQAILVSKGLCGQKAELIVMAYQKQWSFAKTHNLNPRPCFRDVLTLADEVLEGARKAESKLELNQREQGVASSSLRQTRHSFFNKSTDNDDSLKPVLEEQKQLRSRKEL